MDELDVREMKLWTIIFTICVTLFFTGHYFANILVDYNFPITGGDIAARPEHPWVSLGMATAGSILMWPAVPIIWVLEEIRTNTLFPIGIQHERSSLIPYYLGLAAILYPTVITLALRFDKKLISNKPVQPTVKRFASDRR